MSKLSAEKFLEFVERSGLIEKDQLTQTLSSWKEAGTAVMDDGERVAERLIEAKLLTRWQCDNLLKGKHKALFPRQVQAAGPSGHRRHEQRLSGRAHA